MFRDVSSVRERLWLVAHDEDHDLRPRLDTRALEIGLTGAAVVDLLLQNRVYLEHGRVYLHGQLGRRAMDPVATAVLLAIGEQRAPRLGDLLRDPSLHLYERSQTALIGAGVIVEKHRLLRGSRYRLEDATTISWIRSQFTRRLYRPDAATIGIDSLCALVWALNLHTTLLLPYSTAEADGILRAITEQIATRAGGGSPVAVVPHVAGCVRYAIGDLATAPF